MPVHHFPDEVAFDPASVVHPVLNKLGVVVHLPGSLVVDFVLCPFVWDNFYPDGLVLDLASDDYVVVHPGFCEDGFVDPFCSFPARQWCLCLDLYLQLELGPVPLPLLFEVLLLLQFFSSDVGLGEPQVSVELGLVEGSTCVAKIVLFCMNQVRPGLAWRVIQDLL